MQYKQKIVCVIPARLKSTRFPEKMLASLAGKPILEHVWQAAIGTNIFQDVVIACDDQRIADLVGGFGGKYVMTSPECASGTDRLIEVMRSGVVTGDIWVNWQGDEPFISKDMIESLLQTIDNADEEMWTLKKRITQVGHVTAANIAKVVCSSQGFALYFSRSPIPFVRDSTDYQLLVDQGIYYKHVGIYAYRAQTLERIAGMNQTFLEDIEKLEQLRFLDYGVRIKVHETDKEVVGIDTVHDLERAERIFLHAENRVEKIT